MDCGGTVCLDVVITCVGSTEVLSDETNCVGRTDSETLVILWVTLD